MKDALPFAWCRYRGHYHKIEYDVRLRSGEVVEKSWPNAGVFYAWDGRVVSGEEVRELRPHVSSSEHC